MEIHVGTSGYAYKEWKGSFYPEKISYSEMLRFYSEHLSAVEINNTFYQMPRESVLTSWARQVPDDFLFAFKAPQIITHIKRLRYVDAEVDYFFTSLSTLGSRLGPALFQFPGNFRADSPALVAFLDQLPPGVQCAFAFRNPTWIEADVIDILRSRGCSLCLEDTDGLPIDIPVTTSSSGYLRMRRSGYSESDLSEWARQILSQEWEQAFVFFKHEDAGKSPMMAMRFRELVDSL